MELRNSNYEWLIWLKLIFNLNQLCSGQYYRNPNQQQDPFGQQPYYGSQDGRNYYTTFSGSNPQYSQYGFQSTYGRQQDAASGYLNSLSGPVIPVVRSRGVCNIPGGFGPQQISVRTKSGEVTGRVEYLCDGPEMLYQAQGTGQGLGSQFGPQQQAFHNVSVFLGIPYAEAPINTRRFRPPEAHRGWSRWDALNYRAACPQPFGLKDNSGLQVPMDEDCLYLNIFTPSITQMSMEPYPVMIYIHGGEFESGTSAYFPGHMLAASMKVVVVTINYRLGALGFFSTGDGESPGNYGLLDQALAIRWVYENIASFQGNRLKITLFGVDAGAASAGLHMVSPRTRDLFRTVIAQSGAAVADWGAITNLERARNTSRVFAEKVGCDASSSQRLVACLRNRSPRELTEFSFKAQLGFFPWSPVVDRNISMLEQHRFLPDTPEDLIRRGQFDRNKLYVTGITRDEGAYLLLKDIALSVTNFQVSYPYFRQKIREYIKMYNYTMNADGAFNAILYAYTNWADPKNETLIRDGYVNMLSDAIYKAPVDKMVKLLSSQGVRTYMYFMNTSVESLRRPYWQAVPHNVEYHFITGAPFMDDKYFPLLDPMSRTNSWTDEDRRMSNLMMRMWSNIAKYGNPTHSQAYYVTWDPVQQYNLQYLAINTSSYSRMDRNYRQQELSFWSVYMPYLIGPAPPTYPPYFKPWWQYEQPLQIGFWSAVTVCLILLIAVIATCCMYCRVHHGKASHDIDFDGSLPPDDYSLTQPLESESLKTHKYEPARQEQQQEQHTSV